MAGAAGNIGSVDAWLTAMVDPASAQVSALTLEWCVGGTFSSPQTLGGGYPVGLNNGVSGADVVELSVSAMAFSSGSGTFGITALTDDGTSVDQASGGFPGVVFPVLIAHWAALVLALLLGGLVARPLKKQRGVAALLLAVLAFTAWAAHFVLDGQVNDWAHRDLQPL